MGSISIHDTKQKKTQVKSIQCFLDYGMTCLKSAGLGTSILCLQCYTNAVVFFSWKPLLENFAAFTNRAIRPSLIKYIRKEINAIYILKDSTHYPQLQATILDRIERNKAMMKA